jgi:methylenetetrahydrofolate reductase (NADPH)
VKVTEHIAQAKNKTQFTFEILPPLKGQNIQSIYDSIDPLMEFNPPFIDVTYHREEYVYKELDNGLLQKHVIRKRPGTVGICAALQHKYNVDAIPHILCGGFTKEDTENFLIDLDFLGIDNVVALRGDAIKSETYFTPNKEGHAFASDLVGQIQDLNKGHYLDEEILNTSKTDFCIGVSGYPEKHMEAPSLESDLHFLKKKIDAGADYIVTQMFFDNEKYYDFVKICRENNINVPIIPGIKPFSTKRQLNILPQRFHLNLPPELVEEVLKCKNNIDIRQVGIDWAIKQTQELIEFGAPCVHFYTMGKVDNVLKVMANFK